MIWGSAIFIFIVIDNLSNPRTHAGIVCFLGFSLDDEVPDYPYYLLSRSFSCDNLFDSSCLANTVSAQRSHRRAIVMCPLI